MNVVMSWAIQTFLCGGSRLPFGSGAISLSGLQVGEKTIQTFLCGGSRLPFGSGAIPFRVCKWRKGDPNVSVRRIETSFRKRCNSLSGLQIGKKAIQTFLCGGSRLPFGSGAIPFRVCKLAEKAIQTFLNGGSRLPFGSEAIPFRETFGVHRECTRSAPKMHRECTRSAPGVHQKCTRSEPGVNQVVRHRHLFAHLAGIPLFHAQQPHGGVTV